MKGKNIAQKLKILSLVGLMSISLTGCGEELKTFATSDLGQQLDYRFHENQAIIDSLYASELISETVYKDVSKSIEAQREKYLSKNANGEYHANIETVSETDPTFKSGEIIKSVSELRNLDNTIISEINKSDGSVVKIEENIELSNYIISNYLSSSYCWNIEDKNYNNWSKMLNSRVEPIKIIDSESLTFTDNINCDIYVLKKEIFTADSSGGIDGVIELLGQNDDLKKIKNINEYFEKATFSEDVRDASGNVIHRKGDVITIKDLLDIDSLVGDSKSYEGDAIPTGEHGESGNRPGYDMLVNQYDEPVLKIRMEEFNLDEVNKFMVAMGIEGGNYQNTGKWEFVHDNGSNRAYLMEYPVYYISGMKSTDDNSFEELILNESDLGINLKTGKTLAYIRDSEGNVDFTRIIENNGDGYLELAGAVNDRADSQSAYIIAGSTEVNLNMADNGRTIKTETGRLILRDYLEATYAPDFKAYENSNENVAVFGRKIRFTNILKEKTGNSGEVTLKLNKANTCAIFVDKNGIRIENSPELYVNDFCDINSLINNQIVRPTAAGESESEGKSAAATTEASEETEDTTLEEKIESISKTDNLQSEEETSEPTEIMSVEAVKGILSAVNGGTELEETAEVESIITEEDKEKASKLLNDTKVSTDLPWKSTKGEITISTKFPGEQIGNKDYYVDTQGRFSPELQEKQHQTFYAVATTSNLFNTSLYSSWINKDSTEASLKWWRDWLSNNKYIYRIDSTTLDAYLYNNYKYELNQNGVIVLDLEVVAKIQEEMDAEASDNTNRIIRSLFKLLGWLLIVYSVILMLCWLVDTNGDIGLKLTTKLSFGQIIPVKDDTGLPPIDDEHTRYVAFSGMVIRCMIFIFMGVILIMGDIYKIVLFLIKAFGEFSKIISNLMNGF